MSDMRKRKSEEDEDTGEYVGVDLGEFPAQVCSCCGESFTDQETTRKIEAAKKKGGWGLGVSSRTIRSDKLPCRANSKKDSRLP